MSCLSALFTRFIAFVFPCLRLWLWKNRKEVQQEKVVEIDEESASGGLEIFKEKDDQSFFSIPEPSQDTDITNIPSESKYDGVNPVESDWRRK